MEELRQILDRNEKILWQGTPQFKPFFWSRMVTSAIFFPFILMFLSIFLGILIFIIGMSGFLIGFLAAGIVILLMVLAIPIAYFLIVALLLKRLYKRTSYAITNKRTIIRKGLIGIDFEYIDLDSISNAEVNVGPTDKLWGQNSGTIVIHTSRTVQTKNGTSTVDINLSNVTDPYNVFKCFKKITHDTKTDIIFPNKLRPSTNQGYNTSYHPKKKNVRK